MPFTPRRVVELTRGHEVPGIGECHSQPQPSEQTAPKSESSESFSEAAEPVAQPEPHPCIEYPEGEPSNPALSADPVPPICDHQQLIRNEAIRLAAIACGRALRHVAVVHPQTLANFVDDALVAAGRPTPHSISTHQSDANLEFGEVVIESEGSRVEADIETRAKLLVRAAAEC